MTIDLDNIRIETRLRDAAYKLGRKVLKDSDTKNTAQFTIDENFWKRYFAVLRLKDTPEHRGQLEELVREEGTAGAAMEEVRFNGFSAGRQVFDEISRIYESRDDVIIKKVATIPMDDSAHEREWFKSNFPAIYAKYDGIIAKESPASREFFRGFNDSFASEY